MAERERSHTRPLGGVFVAHSQVLSSADVLRALTRMAHEVVERNGGVEDVVLVGLQTGGVPLATKMAEVLRQIEAADTLAVGSLDVAFYRDDIGLRPVLPEAVTDIPVDLAGKVVVLVDDVLFTGRTIRAALNALNDFGRARSVQLAVNVDWSSWPTILADPQFSLPQQVTNWQREFAANIHHRQESFLPALTGPDNSAAQGSPWEPLAPPWEWTDLDQELWEDFERHERLLADPRP